MENFNIKDIETPKTKAQKIVFNCVTRFNEKIDKILGYNKLGKNLQCKDMLLYFHDKTSISVDGTLYDILQYGNADFGYGRELHSDINNKLLKAGFYLENQGSGIYNIVKI